MLNNTDNQLPCPSVHNNGTGERGLRMQAKEAYRALGAAVDVMRQAMPHGRDYYTQESGALEAARAAHYKLIGDVKKVQDAYLELSCAIADAAEGK